MSIQQHLEKKYSILENRKSIGMMAVTALAIIFILSLSLTESAQWTVWFVLHIAVWSVLGAGYCDYKEIMSKKRAITIARPSNFELITASCIHTLALVAFIIFQFAIIVQLVTNFEILFLLSLTIVQFLCYSVLAGFGAMPNNRLSFWGSISVVTICFGLLLILKPSIILEDGLPIEIVGAFVGLFAAISLGELLKAVQDSLEIKQIFQELLLELQSVEAAIIAKDGHPYPIPIWTSVLVTGKLQGLKRRERDLLVNAYKKIELVNSGLSSSDEVLDTLKKVVE